LSNPIIGIDRMKGFYRGLLALNSIEKAKKLNNNSINIQERTKRKQGKNRVKTK
jgi:hypothetical protein